MQIPTRKPLALVAFRIEDDLKREAKRIADEKGVSVSDVYRYAIAVFFSSHRIQDVYDKESGKDKS